MPIQITGLFAPSGGPGSFNLYSPEDIDPGSVDVVLQLIAGGSLRGGSHASSPAGELVVQRKTTTGAPTHSATEGTLCWVTVDDVLYCNNDGATGWTAVGTSTPAAAATPSPPGRDGEDAGDAGYRITGPFGPVGGDMRRELPYPIVHRASQDFALPGVITPTTLAAQVDDFNPTGLATATVIRIAKSGDQSITGLAGGFDGRIVFFVDIDSVDSLIFRHENASSIAANRFALPQGFPYRLAFSNAVGFRYDGTSSRWRPLAALPGGTLARIAAYTSGSGTHTTIPGCRKQLTHGVGGGGGGGGADHGVAQSAAAGGGSGGGYFLHEDDAPPVTVAYTVGAGGAGGAAGPNNGSNGTATTWAASSGTVVGSFGLFGNGGALVAAAGLTQGGSAATSSGANRVNASGTGGLAGIVLGAAGPCLGGQGGSSGGGYGGGGTARIAQGVGNAGSGFGSGGSGGVTVNGGGPGTTKIGGAGKDGILLVYEYT